MPKIDRMRCLHKTIHPNRFDGSHTVCLDCEAPVIVVVSGNGLSYEQSLEQLGPVEPATSVDTYDAMQPLGILWGGRRPT